MTSVPGRRSAVNPSKTQKRRQCRQCFKSFSRDDHLKRHELNHQVPVYSCEHSGCRKRFHRQDVLRRHKTSHENESIHDHRQPGLDMTPPELLSVDVLATTANQNILVDSLSPTWSGYENNFNISYETLESSTDTGLLFPSLLCEFDGFRPPQVEDVHALSDQNIPDLLFELGDPQDYYELPQSAISECILSFRQHCAPRLPFIHDSRFQQNQLMPELESSIAALGALHINRYKHQINQLHNSSMEGHEKTLVRLSSSEGLKPLCQLNKPDILHLQNQVLMIEFAIWSRDEVKREWALKEQYIAAELLRDNHIGYSAPNWNEWRHREELKRTVFAFFIVATLSSIFLDHASPICCQDIRLNLPCDELLWESKSEQEWKQLYGSMNPPGGTTIDFTQSTYALIQRDNTVDCGHESASPFSQYILICALVEHYSLARRSMVNYASLEGFRTRNSKDFLLRGDLTEAFDNCKNLWWASPEYLWESSAQCYPRLENILLLQYMIITVNDFGDAMLEYREKMLPAFRSAAEVFMGCSKVGFLEVSLKCRATISRPGRYCALAAARMLRHCITTIGSISCLQEGRNREENVIISQVCQALRRSVKDGLASLEEINPDSGAKLQLAVTRIWATMLGDDWVT